MSQAPKKDRSSPEVEFLQAFQDAFSDGGSREEVSPDPRSREESESPPRQTREASASPAGISITVSRDQLSATLVGRNATDFTAKSILAELNRQRIIFGVDLEAIKKVVADLQNNGSFNGEVIIARGNPPESTGGITSPIIDLHPAPDLDPDLRVVSGQEISFSRLKRFLTEASPQETSPPNFRTRTVHQGETLAYTDSTASPKPGCTVYGKIIPPDSDTVRAGENVRQNVKNGNYEAMIYGYLHLENNQLSVLSPLVISDDSMSACFISLPQAGTPNHPSPAEIHTLLTLANIKSSTFIIDSIKTLCEARAENNIPIFTKIAAGSPPANGRDAVFEPALITEKRAGTIREDNSMDLKERNMVQSVKPGELLGEKILATRGRPGCDIFGKLIRATDGRDCKLLVTGAIVRKKLPDRILYYAKKGGNISFREDCLILTDIYRVAGDIDYTTGNIEVQTALQVGGSVLPGFRIKAGGNTTIGGAVENGATVFIAGDLEISNGIIGEKTRVVVSGNLKARYIQDAQVMVRGDIIIEGYIFGGKVMSGGSLEVKRSALRQGGKVVGGYVCATREINVSTVGSASNKGTRVVIQHDPGLIEARDKARLELSQCQEKISKMMRTLQIDTVSAPAIKAMLQKIPPDKQQLFMQILENLNQTIKNKAALTDKISSYEEDIARTLQEARIRVTREFFLGNQVLIGEKGLVVGEDLGPSTFQLVNNKIIH